MDRRGAGVPGLSRQRPPRAAARASARQAVPERSSRSVLQRHGRCRDRAGDIPARGRSGGARLLPDQRHPRPCPRRSANMLALPEKVVPGCRAVPRLAGGGGRDLAAPAARRRRCTRSASTKATWRRRSMATIAAAPRRGLTASSASPRASARAEFYGWSEDKARQYARPQRADFGAFVRAAGVQSRLGPDWTGTYPANGHQFAFGHPLTLGCRMTRDARGSVSPGAAIEIATSGWRALEAK